MKKELMILMLVLVTSVIAHGSNEPIWKQLDQPLETRVEALLKELTTKEKIELCWGRNWMQSKGFARLKISDLNLSDGPQGVCREKQTSALPVGINLSCTWNPESAHKYGQLIGEEMLGVKRHWILGPGVNLMRTPLNGRNFEYFGEDPFLAGRLSVGYINGVQSKGVATCIKHLVCNNQENHRWLSSSNVDDRTLREIYLVPFEMAVKEANAWGMMSAYNRINGIYATRHKKIQQDIVKDEWGFDGVIVTDWTALHKGDEKAAILGGLDLEMGSRHWAKNDILKKLVESGEVPMSVIDDKARRYIRLMIRTNLTNPEAREKGSVQTPEHKRIVRELAAEGMVLLKNDNNLLPLDASKLKNILVVGPNANKEHRGGGGSGGVMSPYEITPLQGIINAIGKDKVTFAQGLKFAPNEVIPSNLLKTKDGKPGLVGEYWDNNKFEGEPIIRATSANIDMKWGDAMFGLPSHPKMPNRMLSARFTGKFVSPITGEVKLRVASGPMRDEMRTDHGSKLWINGERFQGLHRLRSIKVTKGQELDIKIEYKDDRRYDPYLQLMWDNPSNGTDAAIAAAKNADAVIFVGGTNHKSDKEGGWARSSHDIRHMELIGPQAELIAELAKVNKNIAVVLVNGSAVLTERWIDQVPSLLEAWYGGQEAGNSIADILFGKVNPSGKLSCTFGKKLDDYACHAMGLYPGKLGPIEDDPHTDYKEGVFIGYRWFDTKKIVPRFPFGFGLSYTTFNLKTKSVKVIENSLVAPKVKVVVDVTNTGKRAGAEVVQIYVHDQESTVERPEKELRAFKKIFLKPGETKTVTLELGFRAFAFWSEKENGWKLEPGQFDIITATSALDIKSRKSVKIR